MANDPFDDLLGLEERFYNEGYQLGLEDGTKAGRVEGRVFGIERGFQKYVDMGKLHGRSLVWNGRHSKLRQTSTEAASDATSSSVPTTTSISASTRGISLSDLPKNSRLEKHLRVLYALTEPGSLSTENGDDSVSDFDDRMKRAQGKIKIIERLVAEDPAPGATSTGNGGKQNASSSDGQNIEDVDILKARH